MNKKKLLLIQPGAFGDIFVCAPIAKYYYDSGYEIYWPTTKKFKKTINYFDYVNNIELDDRNLDFDWLRSDVIKCLEFLERSGPYDLILNLADRGPHTTAQYGWEMAEQAKYRLSNVPFNIKNTLVWKRNIDKENELYEKLVGDESEYIFCHLTSSRNDRTELPKITKNIKIVEMSEIENYNIQDWYKIIKNSKEIYCVESSVQCFIDGFCLELPQPKYLLSRSTLSPGTKYTISNNWSLDYMK